MKLPTKFRILIALAAGLVCCHRILAAEGASGGFIPEQARFIDSELAAGWKEHHLSPSRPCTDYEFIRRASLDLIGRIATPEEIRRFLNDAAPVRRVRLVDRLLATPEFASNWASLWTVWLLTRSAPATYQEEMREWLKERFATPGVGWDAVARDLLTATGKNTENGAANYVLVHVGEPLPPKRRSAEGQFNMVPLTSRTTRLFLGLQIQCAQCHNHPLNPDWKQEHFWGVNAFFRQVERRGEPARPPNMMEAELELRDNAAWNPSDVVSYEKRDGRPQRAQAMFLDGTKAEVRTDLTRRQQLAAFILRDEHFAQAFANRVWGHFFGRGMTTSGAVDDFGDHNPLTHPKLLEYLAGQFRAHGNDPRQFMRWLCTCQAYGLSTTANRTNGKADADLYFSRMMLKAMTPEQLFESLMVAVQPPAAAEPRQRARLRERWMRTLVVNFGDDEGNETTFNGTIVQALLLMNGPEINAELSQIEGGSVVRAILHHGGGWRGVMDDLYLTALNRRPTPAEYQAIPRQMQIRTVELNGAAPWQDLLWALVNSNEFILNH